MIVDTLCQKGILLTNSISELLETIVCDPTNQKCMYRLCTKCCYNEVEFEGPLHDSIITWEQWERIVVSVEEKTSAKYQKIEKSGRTADLLSLLNKKLDAFTRHQINWLHQTRSLRELKHSLLRDELCVHIDFSENYGCKLNREIQAFHFGSSRKQATIHTCVVYTGDATHTYATISGCLRHDKRAVWAHLEPVVRDAMTKCETPPSSLHIISDGPVTQYRNRNNFYLLSTMPFLFGFKSVTRNFSEKAHGKGAPDGVGATVKRLADTAVQRGKDLQTPEDVYDFMIKQKSTVNFVPAVKGTMKLHQVISTKPATILYRDISCFCSRPAAICKCYNPSTVDFRNVSEVPEPPRLNQRGKFIVVNYEGKPFVGQIIQVVGDDIECANLNSPGAKTREILQGQQVNPPVRKALKFHFALLGALKQKYKALMESKSNQNLAQLLSEKMIKKYRCRTYCKKSIGCASRTLRTPKEVQVAKTQKETVRQFYLRDDVSRLTTGKKNTLTVRKVKKQRRLLCDSLLNLHKKFVAELQHISYAFFCRQRPFWVVTPNEKDRETCQCKTHENLQFMADKLYRLGISNSKNPVEMSDSTVCNTSKLCAYGECVDCKQTTYPLTKSTNTVVTLTQWCQEKVDLAPNQAKRRG
ncbi:hypothetical protein JOQ06_007564 [Pogonophryne albipinna]|uniref:Uncharacterized protein n=1 Tax=Pogonophryne albipinna TaxID=1090488 RepID=A0AAD6B134_9TELE|nr:hypothetical protein JOQ06_007564 [Pogonophryne albipinna]